MRLRAIAVAVAVVCASTLIAAQIPQAAETFDAAWTIIKNTHFDKTMNGLNWDAVRDELRPRAVAAKTPAELRTVIRDMLGRLGLSHFALIPSGSEARGDGNAASGDASGDPGIDVRLIGHDLVVTQVDPDMASRVRAGWRLIQIGRKNQRSPEGGARGRQRATPEGRSVANRADPTARARRVYR